MHSRVSPFYIHNSPFFMLPAYETPDPERPSTASPTEEQLDEESPLGDRSAGHDPYAAWRYRDYRVYTSGSFLAALGGQLQATTISYEVANRSLDSNMSAWLVGLAALVQGLPVMLLALPAGQLADRFDRRRIVLFGTSLAAPASLLLAYFSHLRAPTEQLFACLFLIAFINSLMRPAQSALLPQLVPNKALANAVTWNSTRWQIAGVAGPALFGPCLYLFKQPAWIYVLEACFLLAFWACVLMTRPRVVERAKEALSWRALVAGARFVFSTRLILATLTLDLFAVLLGGAVALLPIYQRDILQVSETELGWLRAAPALGAMCMALTIAYLPPMRHAGKALLYAVIGFGAATIVFGLSRNYWVSLAALAVTGAADNISVVVRHTLVQLLTPDSMRGRVSAVNSVFISASNEFGGFESGLVARFFGPVISVVSGGIGTIVVVLTVAAKWPEVARLGRLEDLAPETDEAKSGPRAAKPKD